MNKEIEKQYLAFEDPKVLECKRLLIIAGVQLSEFDSLNRVCMDSLRKENKAVHRHILGLLKAGIRVKNFKFLTLERL